MRPASRAYRPDRPSVAELAAGAVVVLEPTAEFLLLHHVAEDRWCLPKGHVEPGESVPAAALREVTEETGITSVILDREIGQVSYRFYDPRKDRNVFKTTVYWLARTSEPVPHPEPLFDQTRWVRRSEAQRMLPYPQERQVIRRMTPGPVRETVKARSTVKPKNRRG